MYVEQVWTYNIIRQQKHVVRIASVNSAYARSPTWTQIEPVDSVTEVVTEVGIISLVINVIYHLSQRRELQIRVRRQIMREAASKDFEDWLSSSKGPYVSTIVCTPSTLRRLILGASHLKNTKCKAYNAQVRKHIGNLNFRQWLFRCKMTVGSLMNRPFLP